MNNEEIFTALVSVHLPEGSTMTILDGIIYEADVYGNIRVTKGVADRLCADPRFVRCDVKSRAIADATASKEQEAITQAVVEESVKAGAVAQEDIAVAEPKPVNTNAFVYQVAAAAKK